MPWIISEVSFIYLIFRNPFGPGFKGYELEHQIVHGFHTFEGRKL